MTLQTATGPALVALDPVFRSAHGGVRAEDSPLPHTDQHHLRPARPLLSQLGSEVGSTRHAIEALAGFRLSRGGGR